MIFIAIYFRIDGAVLHDLQMCAADEEGRTSWINVLCDERDRIQRKGKYAPPPPALGSSGKAVHIALKLSGAVCGE